MTRRTKLRSKLLLLAASIGMALGIAEIGLRVLPVGVARPYYDVQTTYPVLRPAPFFVGASYGFAPHGRGMDVYDRDPYGTLPVGGILFYQLNDFGVRDAPIAERRKRPSAKIVILGDSFTFGVGVEEEDRFSNVCARLLAEELSEPVDIFNIGVTGYSTMDEAAVARVMVPHLEPKLVVVGYCLNDPIPISQTQREAFDLIMHRPAVLEPILDAACASPSYLWRLVERNLAMRDYTRKTIQWYHDMYDGPDSPWTGSRRSLLSIRDTARSVGAETLVLILPIFYQLEGRYPFENEHRIIAEWCEENDILVLDTFPAFRGLKSVELIVHPMDRHPNAKAHAMIARRLADFLPKGTAFAHPATDESRPE